MRRSTCILAQLKVSALCYNTPVTYSGCPAMGACDNDY